MPQKIKNSNPVVNGGAPEVVAGAAGPAPGDALVDNGGAPEVVAGAAGPAPGDALVDEEDVDEVVVDVVDDKDEEDDKAQTDVIDICSFFELTDLPENGNK